MDAVALPKKVMVEFGNCRKYQKCTDFTQFVPFLALLRTALSRNSDKNSPFSCNTFTQESSDSFCSRAMIIRRHSYYYTSRYMRIFRLSEWWWNISALATGCFTHKYSIESAHRSTNYHLMVMKQRDDFTLPKFIFHKLLKRLFQCQFVLL